MIHKLCIIGVGLIGGSIAKAARERGLCREIAGFDANLENLALAVAAGVVDRSFDAASPDGLALAAQGADWVVIATPAGAALPTFQALQAVWSPETVYTDVGSVKQAVMDAAARVFGELPPNFVPGHPIAGAERSGVAAATASLFEGKRVILTPAPSTSQPMTEQVRAFWSSLDAVVSLMEPLHHDQVFAATSHLPHVLAYALVHLLGRLDEKEEIFQYAGAGFRDFTRIASSNPVMWRDICLMNSEQIVPLMRLLGVELAQLAEVMGQNAPVSADHLENYFAEARNARQRVLNHLEKQQ